jgi:glycerol-3-phosphate acyltransferase PlsY
MAIIGWTLFGFFLGSLPFSVWIGNLALQKDITKEGDHNPGATNVLRAGNWEWFLLALMLDISKGALPVGIAVYIAGISGWSLIPIALAPPLGHAFSPFLNFHGGKAIAATFGAWIGLTLWKVPLLSVVLLVLSSLLVVPSGWAVLLTLISTFLVMLFWLGYLVFLVIFGLHSLLLIFTHRVDLQQRPRLRVMSRNS